MLKTLVLSSRKPLLQHVCASGGTSLESGKISTNYIENIIIRHGMQGKLAQLVIAGHGSRVSIDIRLQENEKKENGEGEKFTYGNSLWQSFFMIIKDYMTPQVKIVPTILLDACKVAANEMYIDVDTKKKSQSEIRAIIRENLEHPENIVTFIKGIVGDQIEVLGAEGSIDSSTQVINEVGNLELQTKGNNQKIKKKSADIPFHEYINYIIKGTDPVGVVNALMSLWIESRDNQLEMFLNSALTARRKTNTSLDSLISILFEIINKNYRGSIEFALNSMKTASILQNILKGVKVGYSHIRNDIFLTTHVEEILLGLIKLSTISPRVKFMLCQIYCFLKDDIGALYYFLHSNVINQTFYNYLYEDLYKTNVIFASINTACIDEQTMLALFIAKIRPDESLIAFLYKVYHTIDLREHLIQSAIALGINLETIIEINEMIENEGFKIKPIKPFVPLLISNPSIILDLPIPMLTPMFSIGSTNRFQNIMKIAEVYGEGNDVLYYVVRFTDGQVGYIEANTTVKSIEGDG